MNVGGWNWRGSTMKWVGVGGPGDRRATRYEIVSELSVVKEM